jgi:hypothetical protein
VGKVTVNAMYAVLWEGPVDEGKGAELCDIGQEEDDDELPPWQVEQRVEGVLKVQLLVDSKPLKAREEGLPAIQQTWPGPILPRPRPALRWIGWHLLLSVALP